MGGRSASNAAWEGHAELQRALEGLATAKGVSANRVKAVATAACQYTKDYKRVVHDVEVFLWKAEPEHRLAGLYAMDAIMRQSQGKLRAKDPFVKRFLLHMSHTISAVKKLPADQQINISHVFEEWQTRGYYTSEEIEEAGGYMYSMNNPDRLKDTQQSASALKASPTHSDAASKEKLASLLSIIKKQKELHETGQQDSTSAQGQGNPSPLLPLPTPSGRHDAPHQQERRDRDRDDRYRRSPDRSPPRSRDDRYRRSPERSPRSRGVRRDEEDRPSSWDQPSRDPKKPRGSRWGPPRPNGDAVDGGRPPAIDTSEQYAPGSSLRQNDHFPPNRFDGPPPGAYPPYQGLPPPYGSDPSQRGDRGPGGPRVPSPGLERGPPPLDRDRFGQGQTRQSPHGARDMRDGHGFEANAGRPDRPLSSQHPPTPSDRAGGFGPSSYDQPPRSSPHGSGPPGDKIPGTSGEVCRKFLAGRCTFGDRCWHVHDQQAPPAATARPRVEINQARRKTVLCSNFPAGNCRFGDRCSFAHGEEDLDKSAVGKRRPSPHGSYDSRWQADDSGASAYTRPSASQPGSPQSRPTYGSNVPVHNGAYGGPGGYSGAPASGYNYLASAYGGNYQGYSGPNGGQGGSNYNASYAMPSQDSHVGNVQYTSYASSTSQPSTSGGSVTTESRSATSANGPGLPSPATVQPPRATPAAPVAPSTRVKDDDDVEANGPEFTLQYDDDD